jgi:hypothetical protein
MFALRPQSAQGRSLSDFFAHSTPADKLLLLAMILVVLNLTFGLTWLRLFFHNTYKTCVSHSGTREPQGKDPGNPGRFEKYHDEHGALLQALKDKDAKRAGRTMLKHPSEIEKDIMNT